MRYAVSGTNGLIGRALCERLAAGGNAVTRIVRRASGRAGEVVWDARLGIVEAQGLEGHDAVVHLAGENIVGLWTRSKRGRIRASRVAGTRAICEAMTKLDRPPRVFLCASAIGYYGSRGDEVLTEGSETGAGFLAGVCREWESVSGVLQDRGVRVVHTRFGLVLSPTGGALKQMLRPFKLGLGGRIGSGSQYMSWVTLGDVVRAILYSAVTGSVHGPINVTAPHPVTNSEFTRTLGRILRRPTLLPVPAWVLKLVLGKMAQETLLSSTRAFPKRLQEAGFAFEHEELEPALRALLGRS